MAIDCTALGLMQAAACYQCLQPKQKASVMTYLLCEWLKKKEGPVVEPISWTPDTEGAYYSTAPVGPLTSVPDLATFRAIDPNTVVRLSVGNNPGNITAIDNVESLPNLLWLYLPANLVSTITINGHLNLQTVDCSNNSLTFLDLSNCSSLTTLNCSSCSLGTINITGDFAITSLDFSSNPAVVIIGP